MGQSYNFHPDDWKPENWNWQSPESCESCEGDGEVLAECEQCEGAGIIQSECASCDGSGRKSGNGASQCCDECEGSGMTTPLRCGGCEGRGEVVVVCEECEGKGWIYP
jgi:DnaJ-class molecular chaperone